MEVVVSDKVDQGKCKMERDGSEKVVDQLIDLI
jgi:hypothetical protein